MSDEIRVGEVSELMRMLTGKGLPEGVRMNHQPSLSPEEAFSVIWYLQEHLHVLPSNFEQCKVCMRVFDTDYGGYSIDNTDIISVWRQNRGVTQEMMDEHDGAQFCSCRCEAKFWHTVTASGHDSPGDREGNTPGQS